MMKTLGSYSYDEKETDGSVSQRVTIQCFFRYTEKSYNRPLFKLILIYEPCSKLNDFFALKRVF